MALPSTKLRRRLRQPRRPEQQRLPHPSWRTALAGGDPGGAIGSARDFWDRLGL